MPRAFGACDSAERMGQVLVLGASGFMGAALADVLSRDPACAVRALVRDPTAPRLSAWSARPNVEVRAAPEWSAAALEAAIGAETYDAVYHLAGTGVHPGQRGSESLIAVNVGLTARIVEALVGPTRVIYVGSCAEYGRVPEGHLAHEDDPVAPLEGYGASKAAGALLGRTLAAARGLRFVHARVFGVYGPGEPGYRLIPSLVGALSRKERVPLTPGAQVRDFMFVEDCARALARLGTATALLHDVYNVCTGRPASVAEVARAVARAVGAPEAQLDFGARPYREGESMWMVGDPARLLADTGFAPEVPLEAGIRRCVVG